MKNQILIRCCLVLLCLWWANTALAQTSTRQILLVQNSGWMLPFYEDPENRFRSAVTDFAGRVTPFSSEVLIASFNQSVGSNRSPLLHHRGNNPAEFAQVINSLQVARIPGSRAYADTDFQEALVAAITEFTPGQPAIIWIITNNRNSPNNSPETIRKNREFYEFLQQTAEVSRIIAFPMSLPVVSRGRSGYSANGLMIYGIAYGEAAAQALQHMLASGRVFGAANVARLKPLDAEALTFVPTSVANPDVQVQLSSHDQKTLILTFPARSRPDTALLKGHFRNDFYPFDIRSAQLQLKTLGFERGGVNRLQAELRHSGQLAIRAGAATEELGIALHIPPLPSMFAPEVIFGGGHSVAGVLEFRLQQQQLVINPDFVASMNQLFPRDPLPDLFVPGAAAGASVTQQPLIIRVEYPFWPLLVVAISALALLAALIALLLMLARRSSYRVEVDGHSQLYAMRAFSSLALCNNRGERVGTLQRKLGQPTAVLSDKFKGLRVSIR